MKPPHWKRHYSITEAAKELGITRAAVHRAIKQGRLEAERGEIIRFVTTRTKQPTKGFLEYPHQSRVAAGPVPRFATHVCKSADTTG
jgi:excisionase family DNA binding protein